MDALHLRVVRRWFTDQATEGDLWWDGDRRCATLEDRAPREAEWKWPGRTAIPPGEYRVTWRPSARFGRPMLTLADVPGFTGVLIHAGNRAQDTAGCLLVGLDRTTPYDDWIGHSQAALARVEARLRPALEAGVPVTLWITEVPEIDTRTARTGPPPMTPLAWFLAAAGAWLLCLATGWLGFIMWLRVQHHRRLAQREPYRAAALLGAFGGDGERDQQAEITDATDAFDEEVARIRSRTLRHRDRAP